jgi:hypothetical protein
MLTSYRSVVVVSEDEAAKPGYIYGILNSTDWNHRTERIDESTVIADRIYDVLGKLPRALGVSSKVTLRSSVTIPRNDINKTMIALVSRDSRTGAYYSHTHEEFTWGQNPNGIAGYSAKNKEQVLIPDIKKKLGKYTDYWVKPSTSVAGGIVALPLLHKFSDRHTSDETCIAVLTTLSKKRNLIKTSHLGCLQEIADEIKMILLESTILPTSQENVQGRLDQLFAKINNSAMGKENLPSISNDSEGNNSLKDIIKGFLDRVLPGKKPAKAEAVLTSFLESGSEGVPMEELREHFKETADPERSATSFIAKLNKNYLKDHDLRIEGETIYRITKTSNPDDQE